MREGNVCVLLVEVEGWEILCEVGGRGKWGKLGKVVERHELFHSKPPFITFISLHAPPAPPPNRNPSPSSAEGENAGRPQKAAHANSEQVLTLIDTLHCLLRSDGPKALADVDLALSEREVVERPERWAL